MLTIPERVVTRMRTAHGWGYRGRTARRNRPIGTGLSDAITVEVTSGLKEGEQEKEKRSWASKQPKRHAHPATRVP